MRPGLSAPGLVGRGFSGRSPPSGLHCGPRASVSPGDTESQTRWQVREDKDRCGRRPQRPRRHGTARLAGQRPGRLGKRCPHCAEARAARRDPSPCQEHVPSARGALSREARVPGAKQRHVWRHRSRVNRHPADLVDSSQKSETVSRWGPERLPSECHRRPGKSRGRQRPE